MSRRLQARQVKPGTDMAQLPPRYMRRNAARHYKVIGNWRNAPRFVTAQGNQVVVYPTTK